MSNIQISLQDTKADALCRKCEEWDHRRNALSKNKGCAQYGWTAATSVLSTVKLSIFLEYSLGRCLSDVKNGLRVRTYDLWDSPTVEMTLHPIMEDVCSWETLKWLEVLHVNEENRLEIVGLYNIKA